MPGGTAFTYPSARSAALTAGLALAVAVETLVVHLWLASRHPRPAWTLTTLGVVTLLYLAAEYPSWRPSRRASRRSSSASRSTRTGRSGGARRTRCAGPCCRPGSQFIAVRAGAQPVRPRRQTDTSFVRSLAEGRERLLERFWAPVVHVHGPLAEVWAPYDFHVDGRFSHCGVDSFSLVRTAAGWQIAGIVYTVETTGCAASPLGPPR